MSKAEASLAPDADSIDPIEHANYDPDKPLYCGHPDEDLLRLLAQWHRLRDEISFSHAAWTEELTRRKPSAPGSPPPNVLPLWDQISRVEQHIVTYTPGTIEAIQELIKAAMEILAVRKIDRDSSLSQGPAFEMLALANRGLCESGCWGKH